MKNKFEMKYPNVLSVKKENIEMNKKMNKKERKRHEEEMKGGRRAARWREK